MQRDGSTLTYGGGCLLLVGFIAGSAVGIAIDQPSLGAIGGVAIAGLVAVALWFVRKDRA